MNAFHIDMNNAQFTEQTLRDWLKRLAEIGYDTILWEVENNIQWETCPECVSPDAFTKEEFTSLLKLCNELGLTSIPLFQTLGHCEYVLKHDAYKHLAEMDDRIDQYCPLNDQLMPFLHRWIEEYLELFGPVEIFHIGADEAWTLGWCDKCKAFGEQYSLSKLFIDHINEVCKPLVEHGVAAALWADMLLRHPEALDELRDDVILFDWVYHVRRCDGSVRIWPDGECMPHEIPDWARDRFGTFLFPRGDEPGRLPETFYTADYLAAHGYDGQIVGCPASACWRDSVFAPSNWYHVTNTFDWFKKAEQPHLRGALLTSWTCHFYPWQLQMPSILLPAFIADKPDGDLQEYEDHWFADHNFGLDAQTGQRFWKAAGLLAMTCEFSCNFQIGAGKHANPIPEDTILKRLDELAENDQLQTELTRARRCLDRYRQAAELFADLAGKVQRGGDQIAWWQLAAENLINRAQCTIYLLSSKLGQPEGDREAILTGLDAVREKTDRAYQPIIKPTRRAEWMDWLYRAVEYAVQNV